MTLKVLRITIMDDGRDKGKVFIIEEKPARQIQKWAVRAFLALARSGVDVPDDIEQAGLAGLATMSLRALTNLHFEDADSLMDELFECVRIAPDPKHTEVVRTLVDSDIEEVTTRFRLHMEAFQLHTGFSIPGFRSTSMRVIPQVVGSGNTAM